MEREHEAFVRSFLAFDPDGVRHDIHEHTTIVEDDEFGDTRIIASKSFKAFRYQTPDKRVVVQLSKHEDREEYQIEDTEVVLIRNPKKPLERI